VGDLGTGTLTVQNGGTVSSLNSFIGASGTGTVTVDDATWTNGGELNVGDLGTGTLTIENGGTVSNTAGRIGTSAGSDGTVTVDGATWTNSGVLLVGREGTGTLTIENGGTVSNTLGHIGDFAGGTGTVMVDDANWTNSGELNVGDSGDGTLTLQNGGTVNVNGGAGTVTLGTNAGAVGTLNVGNSSAAGGLNAAEVTGGAGSAVLNFNHTDANYFFTRDGTSGGGSILITGATAVNHTGSGTTILTGANTYSGATTVNAGSLFVNGSITNSTTTVNAGGTLGGTGTVGNVNVTGGTFAPGNSIGTINVAGNVDFTGGGIYEVEVDAAGNSDLINATGTATLTGGTVSVIPLAGNYNLTTDYTILTAAGGLGGTTFNNVNSTLAFLTPSLTYDANNVFLNLTRNNVSFSSVSTTPNQTSVSTVLSNLSMTNPTAIQTIVNNLLTLTTTGAQQAFDSLSGVQHANVQSILQNIGSPFQQLLFDRLFNANFAALDAPVTGVNAGDEWLSGKGAWFKAYGNFGDIDDTTNASGADYNTYGIAAGFDWPLTTTITAGLAAGYANTSVDPFNGDADVDSYQIAVYAGWQQHQYYVNADVSYGHHSIDSDRQVVVGALAATASADYDADQFGVNVEGGKVIPLNNNTSLTPFVGVDYSHLSRDSFTETGAGAANLSVQNQDDDSLRTKLGVRLSHTIETTNETTITPSIAIAYVREHLDNVSRVQSGFSAAPNTTFLIDGPDLDRNRLALNAGITASFSENSHLNIGYSGEIAGSDDHHAVSATFRYEW